jgi:hypothetical protein
LRETAILIGPPAVVKEQSAAMADRPTGSPTPLNSYWEKAYAISSTLVRHFFFAGSLPAIAILIDSLFLGNQN